MISFDIQEHAYTLTAKEYLEKKYPGRFLFISGDSVVTVKEFAANSDDPICDLIYIDGDHTYEGCLSDIENWYPKVKKGGFLTGDDYIRTVDPVGIVYEVKKAVGHFALKNNLEVYEIPGNEWASGWAIIK